METGVYAAELVDPVDASGKPVHPLVYFPVPVNYIGIEQISEEMMRNHWTDMEVPLEKDIEPFNAMESGLKELFLGVLAFFAVGDGGVSDSLFKFIMSVKCYVLRSAYYIQLEQEQIHNRFYQRALYYYVPDDEQRASLIAGATDVDRFPSVAKKMDWFNAEMNVPDGKGTAGRKFTVFLAMEGIGFSSAFATIFELRDRGHILQFATGNEWVVRDEGSHADLHATTLRTLMKEGALPSRETVIEVFDKMLAHENAFYREILKRPVFSLTHKNMELHLESVANFWLVQAGYKPHWSCTKSPFSSWKGSVHVKTNFFEVRNTAYTTPVLGLLAASSGKPLIEEEPEEDF